MSTPASFSTFAGMHTNEDWSTTQARSHDGTEEEDEIVQELPIVLSQELASTLYLMQSPLRSDDRDRKGLARDRRSPPGRSAALPRAAQRDANGALLPQPSWPNPCLTSLFPVNVYVCESFHSSCCALFHRDQSASPSVRRRAGRARVAQGQAHSEEGRDAVQDRGGGSHVSAVTTHTHTLKQRASARSRPPCRASDCPSNFLLPLFPHSCVQWRCCWCRHEERAPRSQF